MKSQIVELINEYYKLIQKDKKYFNKYEKSSDSIKNFVSTGFLWRKIETIEDIIKIVDDGNYYVLFQITDYYFDELNELMKECSIDNKDEECMSKEYLENILKNKSISERTKDCIEIYLKCNEVCDKLWIEFNNKSEENSI